MGHGTGSFYQKKLDFNSEEFEKLGKIFFDYQGASSDFPISEAYAVYNPLLISNFINQLQILRTRFQKHPDLFKTSQWMLGEESDAKMKINDCYTSRSKALPYNDSDDVVILPTVHGTDFSVARSICSTGFAALSLLYVQLFIQCLIFFLVMEVGMVVEFTSLPMLCILPLISRTEENLLSSFLM